MGFPERTRMLKRLYSIDIGLYIIPIIISALSVALIYSLVFSSEDAGLALKQGLFAILGLISALIFTLVDYRSLRSIWWVFYLTSIILLAIVDFVGKTAGGAMRWIDLGFFQLQPSEVAKLAVIISLAFFFSTRIGRLTVKDYVWSFLLVLIPFILIMKEPDLGTGLVVMFTYLALLVASKPTKKQVATLLVSLIVATLVFTLSVYKIGPFEGLLKDYQRKRVYNFIDPGRDPLGEGYNVRQAQISIGSGGLLGKGLGRGSQSQLKFLPKPHTDFIFAGVGEALGFAGAGILIIIYGYFITKLYNIARLARDSFGALLAVGIAGMMFFQSAVNIGMNLGLAPVTGIPLPFLSNGGTAMIICFALIGIAQSIYVRHKKLNF